MYVEKVSSTLELLPVIYSISPSLNSNSLWRRENIRDALRKLYFHFLSYWMGYDRGDSFPFDSEPNGIPFGSKSKEKLSLRSYPIQYERKWNTSILSSKEHYISVLSTPKFHEKMVMKPRPLLPSSRDNSWAKFGSRIAHNFIIFMEAQVCSSWKFILRENGSRNNCFRLASCFLLVTKSRNISYMISHKIEKSNI